MFDAPSTPFAAGIAAVAVTVVALGFGYLIADGLAGRSDMGPVTRLGLAFPALAGFVALLELAHIATGGEVFSSGPVTRLLSGLAAAGLVAWRVVRWFRGRREAVEASSVTAGRAAPVVDPEADEPPAGQPGQDQAMRAERTHGAVAVEDERSTEETPEHPSPAPVGRRERQWVGLVLALVLATAAGLLWGGRAFQQLPLDQSGDTPSYMGLSTQLLNGETTPSAAISGTIPNAYPWLFNAMTAYLARFTPGGRAYHALNVLQVLLPVGSVLSLFALGWELLRRWDAAAAAAVFGGLAGGFGRRYPFALRRRPYNVAMANLTPPYPGDMTIVLLVGFLVLAAVGFVKGSVRTLICAGVVLGLAGLTGAEAFFVGGVVAVAMALLPNERIGRWRAALALLVPAMAVYAIWIVPMAASYARLGGFVNITKIKAVNLTPLGIVTAFGIATVFGAYGFVRWAPRAWRHQGIRLAILVFASAGLLLLLSGGIPGALGEAFTALGRRHRYWPLLQLGIALLAALGVGDLIRLAFAYRRAAGVAVAVATAAVVLVFGLRVPLRLAASKPSHRGPILTAALEGDPGSVLNVLSSAKGGKVCVAAVPADLQIPVFAYTGYRLVVYRWPGYSTNLARLRWHDIYDRIPGDRERLEANALITGGGTDPGTWKELVDRFGVNLVVVRGGFDLSPVFDPYPKTPAHGTGRDYTVVRVSPCS